MATAERSQRSAGSGWRGTAPGRDAMARPRFIPTVQDRKTVRSMAAYGVRQEEIARCVGLRSDKTLRSHFREELDRAVPEANAQVAQSLYQQATSGKNAPAAMFWLKTRAGWRETGAGAPRTVVEAPPFVVMAEKEAA